MDSEYLFGSAFISFIYSRFDNCLFCLFNRNFHYLNPPKMEKHSILIRETTSEYVGKTIAVKGFVNKTTDVLTELKDFQKLEIQEPTELLKEGEHAMRIDAWVEGDLTTLLKPGDKAAITGILRLMPPKKGESVYCKYIKAESIEILKSR